MQMQSVQSFREQTPLYHWGPVIYLLLFGGVFLICLWAELSRRQRMPKAQTTSSYVRANPLSSTVTACALIRLSPKTNLFREPKKPVFSPCDLIPVKNLKLYG